MNETLSAPLDLSIFNDIAPPAPMPTPGPAQEVTAPELAPTLKPARLVDVANLPPDELAAAQAQAVKIDFTQSTSLLAHGEGVLGGIAAASRQLLSGVRLGDAGEAGQIAAAVIDGIKILRISDLQAEAAAGVKRPGMMGRLLGGIAQMRTAFQGFSENRKQFLTLMDQEQAKARKTKADLAVSIQLLDQQSIAIRQALNDLKIAIAAGQLALDRAEDELEAKRLRAVQTGDPADAAEVQAFRGSIANFRGKVADMREALVGSAMLIPIIQQNRAAAETRMMKVSNGLLVVIPRLMAVASQAVVQVEIRNAADAAAKLDEANRQISLLASKGAHDAATSAARSLGGDQRNIDVLAQVADETIKTMHEVIDIEREIAAQDSVREQKLAEIRNKLVTGMQGVNARGIEK
ncbi:MAG: toxic anion resistance protein [Acidocella sp.]|nr:toxic anion resistance protein [Acidocella sp.]